MNQPGLPHIIPSDYYTEVICPSCFCQGATARIYDPEYIDITIEHKAIRGKVKIRERAVIATCFHCGHSWKLK